jgi:nucleoid DNA-binding protein
MDELIKLVVDKVGISEDQAKQAVEVVIGFIKEQLPEPIAGQIDGLLKGDLGGLQGMIGGLFGN